MTIKLSKLALATAMAITSIAIGSAFSSSAEAGYHRSSHLPSAYQIYNRHRLSELNPQPLPPGPPPCDCDLGAIVHRTGGLKY